jgi:GT2 family glycosyltransferase
VSWVVCVLNWNGREDTLRCLASLRDMPVVVADNGSTDGSVEAIRAAFPDVDVVENGANLGFSGGNNAAIRRALERGADWVVLLNNDAEAEPGLLDALRAAAERHPRAGVLAGKLLYPDGRVQWAGQRVALRTGYSGRPRGHGRPDGFAYSVEGRTDRAVGALMAVSRAAIERAGLLDEDLFAYVEDVDWSLRIRAAGFDCVFVPTARAVHRVSASTGGAAASTHTVYYGVRNTIVVCERHRPLGRFGTSARRACVWVTFFAHAALVLHSPEAAYAVGEGFFDALDGRLGERSEPPEGGYVFDARRARS